jgi:hypothetical protein
MVTRVNDVAQEFRKVSNKQMADTTKRAIRENAVIQAHLSKIDLCDVYTLQLVASVGKKLFLPVCVLGCL